jgi:hypothetical protein
MTSRAILSLQLIIIELLLPQLFPAAGKLKAQVSDTTKVELKSTAGSTKSQTSTIKISPISPQKLFGQ